MNSIIDFELNSDKIISKMFHEFGIKSFSEAMGFIKNLPYGRNSSKNDLKLVLTENKGTCSSKHALLKGLAMENEHDEVKLMLGIFRMNGSNMPKVKNTLIQNNLDYIPEAHNYLKIKDEIYDCTTKISSEINFINDLILEIEIEPEQITDFKVQFHKEFLKNWIKDKQFTLDEIWAIREQCIADLSS